jgi:hypothetical protein
MSGAIRESIELIPSALPPAASPAELLSQTVRPPASADEQRAVDAVFSQVSPQDSAPAGLVGFLSAGALLGQVVHDTLAPPADEVDPDDEEQLPSHEPVP